MAIVVLYIGREGKDTVYGNMLVKQKCLCFLNKCAKQRLLWYRLRSQHPEKKINENRKTFEQNSNIIPVRWKGIAHSVNQRSRSKGRNSLTLNSQRREHYWQAEHGGIITELTACLLEMCFWSNLTGLLATTACKWDFSCCLEMYHNAYVSVLSRLQTRGNVFLISLFLSFLRSWQHCGVVYYLALH